MSNVISLKDYKEKKLSGKIKSMDTLGKIMDGTNKRVSFDEAIKVNKENEERMKKERDSKNKSITKNL